MKKQMDESLGYQIHMVSHFLRNVYNERLGEYGLTHAQGKVIHILAREGEQPQVELQKRLHIKPSSMNGVVESLLKYERISKRPSEEDKRTKLITLTEAGMELHEMIVTTIKEIETEAFADLSQEEQQIMTSWLKKTQERIKSQTAGRENE
ncbi:MarR family transcriptional regulator [Halobacillus kuroshimensis]|uniref:MarR family transcriptional regulator n=1 Tax=Halobacillus kuroshimensis TaxID=302481 RepID=A0ABS3E0F8_9BACI|nr:MULTISPECIES: MarR family transcriptional regulator [Halobacillus]MBN8237086.1 MarR family transcriptional regulator [Halobacillus kuroshimensis]